MKRYRRLRPLEPAQIVSATVSKDSGQQALFAWPDVGGRRLAAVALLLFAFAVTRYAAQDFRPAIAAAILAGALAMWVSRQPQPTASRNVPLGLASSGLLGLRWRWVILTLISAVVANALAIRETTGLAPLVPWLVSIGALLRGFREPWKLPRRTDLAIILTLLVAALASRTVGLGDVPFGIHGDEADWALLALRDWRGEVPLFSYVWLGYPGTSYIPHTLVLGLLGPSIAAVRLATGIVSAVSIPMLYVLGSKMFGRTVGIFAALFFMATVSNFHLGRMGLPNIEALPVEIIGSIAIVGVTRQPSRLKMWALVGISIGLSVEVYLTALVWPPIAVVSLVPIVIVLLHERRRQQLLTGIAVTCVAAVVTASPMLPYVINHPGTPAARGASISIWSEEGSTHSAQAFGLQPTDSIGILEIQVQRSLESFFSRGDSSQQYNGQRGLLDPVEGVSFIIGVAVLVRQWRRQETLLLGVWLVLTLVMGSIVIIDPPFAPRLVGLAPVCAVLAAVGLDRLWRWLAALRLDSDLAVMAAGIASIAVGAYFGFSYYFEPYREHYPNQRITALAWYIRSVQDERTVYFLDLDEPTDYATIQFLAPNAQVLRWDDKTSAPPSVARKLLAVLTPVDGPNADRDRALVHARFPSGVVSYLVNAAGRPLVQVTEISPGAPSTTAQSARI
jgi:4-amino-4-deoxy-L-arabinose transferase-like glycosyltransferase